MPIDQSDRPVLDIDGAIALRVDCSLNGFIGPLAIIGMEAAEEDFVVYRGLRWKPEEFFAASIPDEIASSRKIVPRANGGGLGGKLQALGGTFR